MMLEKKRVLKRWKKAFCRKNIMGTFSVFYGRTIPGIIAVGSNPPDAWRKASIAIDPKKTVDRTKNKGN